jgi:hypothetical protein
VLGLTGDIFFSGLLALLEEKKKFQKLRQPPSCEVVWTVGHAAIITVLS